MVDYVEQDTPAEAAAPARVQGAPLHLWAVGGLSLLWNAFGATDYTLSQLRNRDWLGSAAQKMGATTEEMIAYVDSFPAWMHGFWALGVWGALIGSILLLLRKRQAVWAFALSLLGLAVTQIYQATIPRPAWAEMATGMTIAIWAIALCLLLYATWMRNKDVLR
jgi:hypothetical protein